MNITFIGGGNMATAMIGGLLKSQSCKSEELIGSSPVPEAIEVMVKAQRGSILKPR